MTHPKAPTELRSRHFEGRFLVLFVLALALHLALPMLQDFRWLRVLVGVGLFAVFAYAGWLTVERRRERSVFLGSLGLTVASTLGLLASPGAGVHMAWIACQVGFSFLVTGMLIVWTLRRHRVTADTIFAALSAYFLMAFGWAMTYALIDSASPGSFSVPLASPLQDAFYLSFVTITTLGYGDITPVAPLSRALVTTEALVGQIYLVVLVAHLVGTRIAHDDRERGR